MESFVAMDIEHANRNKNTIFQIGMAKFEGSAIVAKANVFIDPESEFGWFQEKTFWKLKNKIEKSDIFPKHYEKLKERIEGKIVVYHATSHVEPKAINSCCERYGLPKISCRWLETTKVIKEAFPDEEKYGLDPLSKSFSIPLKHHDARSDAIACGKLLILALNELGKPLDQILAERAPRSSVRHIFNKT